MNESGLLLVDKPKGLSSAAVVAKIKHQFKFDKVGHGGTLDPFATGLLVIMLGEGTKIARFLLEGNKSYLAAALIGHETETGDPTGAPKESAKSDIVPSLAEWEATRPRFLGKILQKPPIYSALKKDGQALYKKARAGEVFETEAREVFIEALSIKTWNPPRLDFEVTCGGGTYIRSLAVDWAQACQTRAHLSELRRTQTLGFSLSQAHTLEDILARNREVLPILNLREALSHLPILNCDKQQAQRVMQGNLLAAALPIPALHGMHLLQESDRPVAILSYQEHWQIERVFAL